MNAPGPFGLWMGMRLDQIGSDLEKLAPGRYSVLAVPTPHSLFEVYVVQVSAQAGLAWIKAVGRSINTSAYGHELQSAFESMAGKLGSAYGAGKRFDFLMEGSIWNEPRDYMQALRERERVLAMEWSAEYDSPLRKDVTQVSLFACVGDGDTGYLAVEYVFSNKGASDYELAALEDGAL